MKHMEFNTVSRNRVLVLILFVALYSTTVCAQEQEKQDDRFTPKVAGSNWKKDDPVTAQVMQLAAMLRAKLLEDPHRPTYHFYMPENGPCVLFALHGWVG